MRSRSVSGLVLTGTADIPALPARLVADWEREIQHHLELEPGDVEELPLARARLRWPDYSRCVQAASEWAHTLGLAGLLASSDMALMACRGAHYHHDGAQYGGSVFFNVFLSEDKGLDLHFPSTGQRFALRRGTTVVFDTGQPHAVIPRGSNGFQQFFGIAKGFHQNQIGTSANECLNLFTESLTRFLMLHSPEGFQADAQWPD